MTVSVRPHYSILSYGGVKVTLEDIQFLKDLRLSSQIAIGHIGRD